MTRRQKHLLKLLEVYSKYNMSCSFQINGTDAKALLELIDKPVETTNEQPQKYDMQTWFEDQVGIDSNPFIKFYNNSKSVEIQLYGMAINLNEDGTYFLTDTTGG